MERIIFVKTPSDPTFVNANQDLKRLMATVSTKTSVCKGKTFAEWVAVATIKGRTLVIARQVMTIITTENLVVTITEKERVL